MSDYEAPRKFVDHNLLVSVQETGGRVYLSISVNGYGQGPISLTAAFDAADKVGAHQWVKRLNMLVTSPLTTGMLPKELTASFAKALAWLGPELS